ncbi:uncharacterized protein LOC110891215 [Helianthus annuus]|uniref:uncharacterized protein LOC110891215 n=1 Tax=Helianthus annuus TaxID=4232 RepID=UPI000B8F9F1B|nr:uncharacterized protein LOC110891215 [Helianthus annuus]
MLGKQARSSQGSEEHISILHNMLIAYRIILTAHGASSLDLKVSESNRSAVSILTKNKRGRKRKSESISSKSSKSSLKTVRRARKFKFSGNKIKNSKILKRSPRSASAPRPIVSITKCTSSQQKSGPKLTKKNLSLHSPVFKEGGLPDGTELTYVACGKKCLNGYKLGNGIFCSCCKTGISASQFVLD